MVRWQGQEHEKKPAENDRQKLREARSKELTGRHRWL
jgi:hypothetical protein